MDAQLGAGRNGDRWAERRADDEVEVPPASSERDPYARLATTRAEPAAADITGKREEEARRAVRASDDDDERDGMAGLVG